MSLKDRMETEVFETIDNLEDWRKQQEEKEFILQNRLAEWRARKKANQAFSNPCHAPEDGRFCETQDESNWEIVLREKVDHIPVTTQKYWLTPDGGFVPVEFHGQVLTERKGDESPYTTFAKKTRAVRIDSSPHDANIELFIPASEDQISAIISELKRPKVYIASNSATFGFGQTILENPTGAEIENALNTANDHLKGNTKPPKSAEFLSIDGNWSFTNHPYDFTNTEIIAAGIAVLAEDTRRVLMIQRALTEDDPAAGKWEFPGGTLDPGETPIQAAVREFQEETGLKLPEGEWTGQHLSSNGVYKLFVWSIPTEDTLTLNPDHEDRKVLNPDDPDGDNIEVIAWWNPLDLVDNPAVRDELRDTDWKLFQTHTPTISEPEPDFSYVDRLTEFYNKCHDEESGKFCEDPVTKKQVKVEQAPPEEHKAAKAKAKAWVRIAKVPSAAEVQKGRANSEKAKQGKSHRTTTEDRGGSAEARRKQRENLFVEFGGEKRGYVIDHQSGVKLHWTDDPALNPNQYPMFTRGRIFTSQQGGGYTLDNLLPESYETNRKRGSRQIRKENQS